MSSYAGARLDPALADRTTAMITRLRERPDSVPRKELVGLVTDLTRASLEYHFVRPLDDLGIGFATKKSIQVSIASVIKIISRVLQQVIGGLPANQYAKVANYLEDAYLPDATDRSAGTG